MGAGHFRFSRACEIFEEVRALAMAKRKEVESDLLDQLDRNGTVGRYYTDLVSDYMALWDTKKKLIGDIKERGTKIYVETATTRNLKTNDSVQDLLKVNAQMLKILDCLGIKPEQTDGDEDEL